MPASAEPRLICVDPARVHEFWPHVRDLVHQAFRRGDVGEFATVEAALASGGTATLLWLVCTDTRIVAVVVTELQLIGQRKVCAVLACSGAHMQRWLPLITGIEKYACAEGCAAVRIVGRKGWARVLPDYRPHRVILERKLS